MRREDLHFVLNAKIRRMQNRRDILEEENEKFQASIDVLKREQELLDGGTQKLEERMKKAHRYISDISSMSSIGGILQDSSRLRNIKRFCKLPI